MVVSQHWKISKQIYAHKLDHWVQTHKHKIDNVSGTVSSASIVVYASYNNKLQLAETVTNLSCILQCTSISLDFLLYMMQVIVIYQLQMITVTYYYWVHIFKI